MVIVRFPVGILALCALGLAACASDTKAPLAPLVPLAAGPSVAEPKPPARLQVETRFVTLDNGLRVVMSRAPDVPTVTVGVYYGIGFRIEPRNRTGFAHLFEHLMFQGSANAPKGAFDTLIYRSGGVNNGSTTFDYTNYYEVVPSNALEAVLWIEADRMARPVIDEAVLKNQQGVVTNEVKVNVLNQPYGSWPWIDLPMLANTNWFNSHNFYGDLKEIEAATVKDSQEFFGKFYRPNNAVLVIAGDIDYAQTLAFVHKYFDVVPKGAPISFPDISEPRQESEKFASREDPLAPKPGYAAGYHVPPRGSRDWFAMGLLDQILLQGEDSRLHKKFVEELGITGSVDGGINLIGTMFDYNGPMLWALSFVHDGEKDPKELSAILDGVIESVRSQPVSQEELDRARTKLRSNLYDLVDSGTRFGLIDLLAAFALFDNDPARINAIEQGFAEITPAQLQASAQEYLRPGNRSVMVITPGAKAEKASAP